MHYSDDALRRYLDVFYGDVGGVDHAALVGGVYSLQECHSCGLVFQRDIPDATLSQMLYEQWIDPQKVYNQCERVRSVNSCASLARQVESIIRHFGAKPVDLKVLDLGMGWGRWCMFANAYGCETYGLEVSPARIAHARARGVRVLDYGELAQHEFNMINAEQVLEHLPAPLDTLNTLRACLRPGGLLWISVPDGSNIREAIQTWDWDAPKHTARSLNPIAPLEHLNCFSNRSLLTMTEKSGFRPVSIASVKRAAPVRGQLWRRWFRPRAVARNGVGTSMYFTPVP